VTASHRELAAVERIRREALVLSNFQRYFAPISRRRSRSRKAPYSSAHRNGRGHFFSDIRGFTPMSGT